MAQLIFRYGAVSSAKTLNLLAVLHNYRQQGKRVLLVKPAADTRSEAVESRAGLSAVPDVVLGAGESLESCLGDTSGVSSVLVDEVQFFEPGQVEEMRHISIFRDIPVLCYGLRTTSEAGLWPAAAVLMAVADKIEEIKTTCAYCNRKAVFSKRVGEAGPSWDAYEPVCPFHFYSGKKDV